MGITKYLLYLHIDDETIVFSISKGIFRKGNILFLIVDNTGSMLYRNNIFV